MMEKRDKCVARSISDDLYDWAQKSSIVEKAFKENVDSIKGLLHSFLFEAGEKKESAGNALYKMLWAAHYSFGPLPPIDLLQKFEFDRVFHDDYRDHTMHSLTTCLLGLYIYENNSTVRDAVSTFFNNHLFPEYFSDDESFVKTWLLTSLYHDIGYLVENKKVDEKTDVKQQVKTAINSMLTNPLTNIKHFSDYINGTKETKFIMDNHIFRPNIQSIDDIETDESFSHLMDASKLSNLGINGCNGVKAYFIFSKSHIETHRKAGFRDHGISSALLLLYTWTAFKDYIDRLCETEQYLQYYSDCHSNISKLKTELEDFFPIMETAAQAISLHNISKTIWDEEDTFANKIDLGAFCVNLKDKTTALPFAFLLRVCDEMQVWDRPRFRAPLPEDNNDYSPDISISVSDDGIFLRFFQDEEEYIDPATFRTSRYTLLKKVLEKYLNTTDLSELLKCGSAKKEESASDLSCEKPIPEHSKGERKTGKLLYSTCSYLAYMINKRFYHSIHYVCCSDAFSDNNQYTSSPKNLCARYLEAIKNQNTNADIIVDNVKNIKNGAAIKRSEGVISVQEEEEICFLADNADWDRFFPLLYLIDRNAVEQRIECKQKTSHDPYEYIISDLKQHEFSIISYKHVLDLLNQDD